MNKPQFILRQIKMVSGELDSNPDIAEIVSMIKEAFNESDRIHGHVLGCHRSVYGLNQLLMGITQFQLGQAASKVIIQECRDVVDFFKNGNTEELRNQGETLENFINQHPVFFNEGLNRIFSEVMSGPYSLYEEKLNEDYGLKVATSHAGTKEDVILSTGQIRKRNFLNQFVKVSSTDPEIKRYASMLIKSSFNPRSDFYLAWINKIHEDQSKEFVWRYSPFTDKNHYMFHFTYILKDHFQMKNIPD